MNTRGTDTIRPRLFKYLSDMLGMIKFSHTLFALPFALLGALLASHDEGGWIVRPLDWLGILLCMFSARSAAMAFNRLSDRELDARNPRTRQRHLPVGALSVSSVRLFTVANALFFIASTFLFLPRNPWPALLSIPVLAWLLTYSYAKRFTSFAHFWLGASLALAPVAAWLAVRGSLGWPPLFLGLAVLFWVAGFDIIYSCQDVEFDKRAGLHSIPARLGIRPALRLAALCHAAMVLALGALGVTYPLGVPFWMGLCAVVVLLIYEHALVRPEDLHRVNLAFFRVNIAISCGLLAVGAIDLIL